MKTTKSSIFTGLKLTISATGWFVKQALSNF